MSNKNTPKKEWEHQYEREYNRIKQAINRQKKLGYFVPEEIIPLPPSKVKNITPEDVERMIELTPKKIRKSSVYIDTETGEAFSGLDIVRSHHIAKPSQAKIKEPSTPNPTQITTPKPKQITTPKQKTRSRKASKQPKEKAYTDSNNIPPKENNLNLQIIDTINDMLNGWYPAPYWHSTFLQRKTENYYKIITLWKETLENEGEYEVAYRLESSATELFRLLERLLYSSDSAVEDDFNMGRFIELLIGRPLTAIESDAYAESAREMAMDSLRGENSLG